MSRPAASAPILAAGTGAHRSDVVGPTQPGIGVSSETPSPLGGEGVDRQAFTAPLADVPAPPTTDDGLPLLLGYQARWVADDAKVKVAEKSRRIGLTWGEAFDDVTIAAASRGAGGQNVYYLGYNLEMTREYIAACAMWAKSVNAAIEGAGETVFSDTDEKGESRNIKAFRIDFASGFSIVALPSRPRSLRGMQGTIVIDEAAFHDDLPGMLKAAFAMLFWGGKVRIISTHFGSGNAFNEVVAEARSGSKPYKLHTITLDQAIADGLYRRVCTRKRETWSQEGETAWREEILAIYRPNDAEECFCVPSEGAGAYLSLDLLERCANDNIPVVRWAQDGAFLHKSDEARRAEALRFCTLELLPVLLTLPKDCPHAVGSDFARSGDLTIDWVGYTRPDMKRVTALVVELRNIPFTEQEFILGYIISRLPRFNALKVDATGNGSYVAERMLQRFGAARVECVHFSRDWYIEHNPRMKAGLEDGRFLIPRDRDLIEDFRLITMVDGCPRVPEKRLQGKDGGKRHGDGAVAATLFYAASEAAPWSVDYTPVTGAARDKHEPKTESDRNRMKMRPGNDDDKPRRTRGY